MPGIWTKGHETEFAGALSRLAIMFGRELTKETVAYLEDSECVLVLNHADEVTAQMAKAAREQAEAEQEKAA